MGREFHRFSGHTEAERFWAKVDKTPGHGPQGECWPWTAGHHTRGYGWFSPSVKPEGGAHMVFAHRKAFELECRELVEGEDVLHSCDYPPCCRPSHLSAGTHADNMTDMVAKRRHVIPTRKLSVEQANELRSRYQAGGVMQKELAAEVGMTTGQMSRLLRGLSNI